MSEGIAQLIPLILIFIIFYFFLIRPQQKKVKEHKIMVENLKRGDKVITSGGIIGEIERIIDQIISEHPDQVSAYKGGKDKLFGFFVGQIMKATQGKANPASANKILKDKIDN